MDHMGGTATSTADMGTSTSSMDHGGGHDHMSGGMDVIFITSSRTALFWSVSNAGHYAGSCIFLIVLGCLMRFLLALRPILETRFWGKTAAAVAAIRTDKDSEEESQMLPAARPGQALAVLRKDVRRGWSGWRVSTAAWRAMYDLVIAGIGYLLCVPLILPFPFLASTCG